MKQSLKKVLAVLLVGIIALTVTILTAFAADSSAIDSVDGCPLNVEFTTDKSSYGATDIARFTVSIKNNSDKTINNVSAISDFTDVQLIRSNNQLFIDGESLLPGESISYTFSATVKPSKANFIVRIILLIKSIFIGKKSAPVMNFDDGRNSISATVATKFGGVSVEDTVNVWYEPATDIINTKTE